MHVPESVIIPCAVVVRFFPTVQEDYHQIHNAMALRGIAEGKGALLLHPMQSLEYILMPLLMNGNNVAQDLSVAALTKGIGLPGTHTCMTELHLTVWDFIYGTVYAAAAVEGGYTAVRTLVESNNVSFAYQTAQNRRCRISHCGFGPVSACCSVVEAAAVKRPFPAC